ncbi:ABC transporter substrate-binding protein [Actinoallomurus sp. CA-150999]|uniref:ABC transporter substrate-binding protein n=1 Tax=Actinoallomurus sp. CA-150999 TaxID=3239887 RepID=UPI003D8D505F
MKHHLKTSAVLALAALTAACSGTARSNGKTTTYQLTAGTGTPRADLNSFTWSIYAEPTSIDYAQSFDYPPNQVLANVCESLLRWKPDLSYGPALASGYQNPTPTTWVYDIRPGVRFHDGTRLTADDVVTSLRRNLDPQVASVWATAFRNVESVTKTGPLQVTVALKKPDSAFNQYMATAPGTIESAATLAKDGKGYGSPQKGVNCTGPFSFGSWTPGQSIVLKRFDGYWDQTLKAHSGQVKFVFIPDPTARINAFQSGEVDGGWMLPPASYDQLKKGLYFGRSTTVADEVVSNLHGPLGDPRVRQALLMATDRKGLISSGAGGVGDVANSLVTPNNWNNAPAAIRGQVSAASPTYPYDVAKARALAKQAGVNGQQVVIATSPLDTQTTIATQAVAQAATAIGLKPKIDTISTDKYTALFTDPAARKGIDLFVTFWYTSITDPLDMYVSLQTGSFSNYGGWSNSAYDQAIDQAIAASDPTAKAEATARAQKIALQQLPWLPLYAEPVSLYLGPKITGVAPSINYLYYPWAASIGAK